MGWLGDVEDRYGDGGMDVGVHGDTIMLNDTALTPLQAAQLALLLIRAYWLARGAGDGSAGAEHSEG